MSPQGNGQIGALWPWLVLPARLLLFASAQLAFAVVLGNWDASITWWPLAATLINVVTIILLMRLLEQDGSDLGSLFRVSRLRSLDLVLLGVALLEVIALALVPSMWLSAWLYGDPQTGSELLVGRLPLWAAMLALAFPLTMVFAELPLYFGYAMPHIAARTGKAWIGILAPALFLAIQHITLPLIFDTRFIVLRALSFLPLALFLGVLIYWRPRYLPFLAVVHGLLDLSVVVLLLIRAN